MSTLHMDQKTALAMNNYPSLSFHQYLQLLTAPLYTLRREKHEEESATLGQRKQGVEAQRWLRMEGAVSSQKHAGMEGRYINRRAALVQLTTEPPEILSHTESMNSALRCQKS